MSQPTFPDGPPVPLMVEGVLDAGMLTRFADDLAKHAQVESIRVKGAASSHSLSGSSKLATVLADLQSGTCRAVQIRYAFDGFAWTDTLLSEGDGYRVVRCRHDSPSDGTPTP